MQFCKVQVLLLLFINFTVTIFSFTENEIRDAIIAEVMLLKLRVPDNINELVKNIATIKSDEMQLVQIRQVIDLLRRQQLEGIHEALRPELGIYHREQSQIPKTVAQIIQECLGQELPSKQAAASTPTSEELDIDNYQRVYPIFEQAIVNKLRTGFPDISDKSENNLKMIAASILNGMGLQYFNQQTIDQFNKNPREFIDNLPQMKSGFDNRGQIYNLMLPRNARPRESVVSSYGQYKAGGVSACTPVCFRAAEQILCNLQKSEQCLIDIVDAGKALYNRYLSTNPAQEHSSISDLIEKFGMPQNVRQLNAFDFGLSIFELIQLNINPNVVVQEYVYQFKDVPRILFDVAQRIDGSVCSVITKSPETSVVCYDLTTREFIFFDSHSQHIKGAGGSGLHIFDDSNNLVEYLKLRFPFTPNLSLDEDRFLNRAEMFLFARQSSASSSS